MTPHQFQEVARHLPDPLLLVASDGRVLSSNAAAALLFGAPVEAEANLLERLGGGDGPVRELLRYAGRTTDPIPGSAVVRTAEGPLSCWLRAHRVGDRVVLVSVTPRSEKTDQFRRLSKQVEELRNEIDRRARAEEEAREAIRVRDEFFSLASHELRTPLTSMLLDLQLLQRKLAGHADPEVQEILANAGRGGRTLNRFIGELLDIARIQGGQMRLEFEDADLAEIARRVIEGSTASLARSVCPISLEAPEPVRGTFDPLRLEQVVTNLLTNAIKYGEGKPVRVSVFARDGQAILEVEDRGIGIPPEDQEKIFRPYYRTQRSKHYGGLGLGLSIVRKILEAHGGTIEVRSAPGAGSHFRARLPFVPPR